MIYAPNEDSDRSVHQSVLISVNFINFAKGVQNGSPLVIHAILVVCNVAAQLSAIFLERKLFCRLWETQIADVIKNNRKHVSIMLQHVYTFM